MNLSLRKRFCGQFRLHPSHILTLRGSPALSAFWHMVECSAPLDAAQRGVLEKLLTYGPAVEKEGRGALFFVVPRFGTILPWASKATDVAPSWRRGTR